MAENPCAAKWHGWNLGHHRARSCTVGAPFVHPTRSAQHGRARRLARKLLSRRRAEGTEAAVVHLLYLAFERRRASATRSAHHFAVAAVLLPPFGGVVGCDGGALSCARLRPPDGCPGGSQGTSLPCSIRATRWRIGGARVDVAACTTAAAREVAVVAAAARFPSPVRRSPATIKNAREASSACKREAW